jgi:acyl-CoA synthetase (AMP-forming)/AMP-acid ligase II
VAALRPRHRPDAGNSCAGSRWIPGGPDEPGVVPAAAGALDPAAGKEPPGVWSAAPNFAYELVAEKTSDNDMVGLDLRHVLAILDSGELIHPASVDRFMKRFARFNLPDAVIRPTYGLPEATADVATRRSAGPPHIVRFESDQL